MKAVSTRVPADVGVRVVKVGGSLFAHANLPPVLKRFLDRFEPQLQIVIVTGGGAHADEVRARYRNAELNETESHWRAIEAMTRTARELAETLVDSRFCDDFRTLQYSLHHETARHEKSKPSSIVFDPGEFARSVEPSLPGTKLPIGWHVTSDSIAARLASVLNADELLILKSAPFVAASLQTAADSGFVDKFFPVIAPTVRDIHFVDFSVEIAR